MATVTNTAIAQPGTSQPTTTSPVGGARRRVWRHGVAFGAAAAVVTCATVLIARAAGVPVAVQGEEIPLLGFAQFTVVGALLGVALARLLSTCARRPRSTFVRTTAALTVISFVPDVLVDATIGSKLVLALTHVLAAAIIIPALATRVAHRAV